MKFASIVATAFLALGAVAMPVAKANAVPALPDLNAINTGFANITGEVQELTTLLTTADIPKESLTQIVDIVKDTVTGLLETLGGLTGLDGVSDALNNLLNDTFAKLDGVLENSGLDATLNRTLDALLLSVKALLSKLFETIGNVLDNLLHLNLVGALVSLLAGLFAGIDLLLSNLKNVGLPAK